MSDTLKRLEKIERELAVGDEAEIKVYIVTFRGPGQEPSPEESEDENPEEETQTETPEETGVRE